MKWDRLGSFSLLLLLLAQPTWAGECKNDIDRRFTERITSINKKILVTQDLLRKRLQDLATPDDVIRAFQQDVSRLRQQRDETAMDWVLIIRRHQEPDGCGHE